MQDAASLLRPPWSHPAWFHALRGNHTNVTANAETYCEKFNKACFRTAGMVFCPVELFCWMTTLPHAACQHLSTCCRIIPAHMLQHVYGRFLLDSNEFSSIHCTVPTSPQMTRLFPMLTDFLSGNHLESDVNVNIIVLEWLNRLVAEFKDEGVQILVSNYDECLICLVMM